jgi:F-type H+-transporting ATPase subunit gamma
MSTIRDLKRRIRSVQSTQQITKAMEMVSAAKLRRAQRAAESARPYARAMASILEHLSMAATARVHPLFERRETGGILLVVVSADRGLCGSFNTNVVRRAVQILKERSGEDVRLLFVGKKAWEYFRRRTWPIAGLYRDWGGKLDLARGQEVTDDLLSQFLSREVREVHILYNRFISTMVRRITLQQFLPIEAEEEVEVGRGNGTGEKPVLQQPAAGGPTGLGAGAGTALEYIFEPSPDKIFETLLPRYALTRVLAAILESFAAEHSARMVAMSTASTNAEEMIGDLVLLRNRIRQAGITREIAELVGGAEALK